MRYTLVVSYAECAQWHVAWEWTVSGNSPKLPQIIIKKATSADCMTVVRFKQRKVVRRHVVEDITCFCLGFLVRRLLLRSLNPVYIHYWLPEEVGIKLVIVMHMGWQLVLHELHNHTSCHFFEAQSERWNRFTQLLCSPPSAPHVHVFPLCPCGVTRGTKPGYKTSFPPSLPSHPSHFLYILQLFFPLPTQILLSLGASPNYRDAKGLTPVYHTAIMGDDTGACEALLRYRAELGIKDQGGWTELHQVGRITVTVPCIIIHQRLFHHILWMSYCWIFCSYKLCKI